MAYSRTGEQYTLADKGRSCTHACSNIGMICDAVGLKAIAILSECERIINDVLMVSTGNTGDGTVDNLGCVYHDAHSGHAQVLRKDGDPLCETEGTSGNLPQKQRVCACSG